MDAEFISNSLNDKLLLPDGSNIEHQLKTDGVLLLKNLRLPDNVSIRAAFLEICTQVGQPVPHDKIGSIVWDIKSRLNGLSQQGINTFSEHNFEADLHTDSQYSEYPEDYFALLTLQKAQCGGGASYLLSLKDILEELSESQQGNETRDILESTAYPFIVPTVFKKASTPDQEFVFGPILQENEIRFRIDTIQKALDYNSHFCTKEQITAFNFLVQLVRNTRRTKRFFLENGDLIFINNKTMLHGRSSFSDPNRHLLRIRMNKRST